MEKTLLISNHASLLHFVGPNDENLKFLRKHTSARVVLTGDRLTVSGEAEEVESVSDLIGRILESLDKGDDIRSVDIRYLIENAGRTPTAAEIFGRTIVIPKSRTTITARTRAQAEYLHSIEHNEIVVGTGPAGTGKTYLAVAWALHHLLSGRYRRLILTRPVVEAGENLGFLPGTLEEKIHPYLRPLTDAVLDMIDYDKFQRLVETRSIEIAPLAYMRGRTLNDAFIILDEAQNTTTGQMRMFLTRFGNNSRVVVTGDTSQIDLPRHTPSGLVEIVTLLDGIPGIRIVRFDSTDVVRHPLVKKIIEAYAQKDAAK
jgi:phosphate starvation-inducible PhoH-like protein